METFFDTKLGFELLSLATVLVGVAIAWLTHQLVHRANDLTGPITSDEFEQLLVETFDARQMHRVDVCVECGMVIEPAARYFTEDNEPIHLLCDTPTTSGGFTDSMAAIVLDGAIEYFDYRGPFDQDADELADARVGV